MNKSQAPLKSVYLQILALMLDPFHSDFDSIRYIQRATSPAGCIDAEVDTEWDDAMRGVARLLPIACSRL